MKHFLISGLLGLLAATVQAQVLLDEDFNAVAEGIGQWGALPDWSLFSESGASSEVDEVLEFSDAAGDRYGSLGYYLPASGETYVAMDYSLPQVADGELLFQFELGHEASTLGANDQLGVAFFDGQGNFLSEIVIDTDLEALRYFDGHNYHPDSYELFPGRLESYVLNIDLVANQITIEVDGAVLWESVDFAAGRTDVDLGLVSFFWRMDELDPGDNFLYADNLYLEQLGSSVPGDYATWAAAQGIAGEGFRRDFDGDGLSNGMEYALGLDPTSPDASPVNFDGRRVSYTKGAEAVANGDVSYLIETSQNLERWTPVAANDGEQRISYRLPDGNAQLYARLSVSLR